MQSYFNEELVQQLYPEATMIPAMLIWSLPKNKKDSLEDICGNGEYFAQLKKDGYFYQFNKTEHYNYLFSRNTGVNGLLSEKSANVPHITEALSVLPPNTIVIGEVYYPGKTSKAVTTIMGCLAPEAVARQERAGKIHFYIHDIIMYNGVSLINTGALNRYRILEKVYQKYELSNFSFIELATNVYENIYEKAMEALDNGEEGMVLKWKNAVYSPDKRPAWSTIKIKMVDNVDVVCMGFCDATKEYNGKELYNWDENDNKLGEKPYWEVNWPYWIIEKRDAAFTGEYRFYQKCEVGKPVAIRGIDFRTIPVTKPYYYGWKTAMRIGAFTEDGTLKEIGTISSGLTDELKNAFSNIPQEYIGKVVEVQCMMKDNKELTLRHGFFVRFRDDKNIQSCTLKSVFK